MKTALLSGATTTAGAVAGLVTSGDPTAIATAALGALGLLAGQLWMVQRQIASLRRDSFDTLDRLAHLESWAGIQGAPKRRRSRVQPRRDLKPPRIVEGGRKAN